MGGKRSVEYWSIGIALAGAVVAVLTWITSARKGRVDNLCRIIDAQAAHILKLEATVTDLQSQLTRATQRITELEATNRRYRRLLVENCIDPDPPEAGTGA